MLASTLGLFAFAYGVTVPKYRGMEAKARVRVRQLELDLMRERLTTDYLRLEWMRMSEDERAYYAAHWGYPTWAHPTQTERLLPRGGSG